MELELFQTTVREYKRFILQLPLDYTKAMTGDSSDFTYVAVHTRLMLLRKYTRSGRGSLYLVDIIDKAICRLPQHSDYLSELKNRFLQSCDQSLNHVLADGTERTLDESIDDTMYGLHLHADKERIIRITHDNNFLRLHCALTFVKEVELLVVELFDFFLANNISCIEKENHSHAPVIHLDSQSSSAKNILGSPFWKNLIGSDMTAEKAEESFANFLEQYTPEELQLWVTASSFTKLLGQEDFSYDKIKQLVYEPTISDWGDFSDARAHYKSIPSPGTSTTIRYNEQHDTAYIHVYPHVEEGFIVDSPQIISDVQMVTLVKDQRLGAWRVFAFGGRLDPHIRR